MIFSTFVKSDKVLLTMITLAPASAKAIAQAFPRPFPAPVTKAVLFLRSIFKDRSNFVIYEVEEHISVKNYLKTSTNKLAVNA